MRLGLQGRFLLILCLVSLLQLVLLSGASYYYVAEQRYREVGDQALDVARLVARAVVSQPPPPGIRRWTSLISVWAPTLKASRLPIRVRLKVPCNTVLPL